jgi:hypothetical protein
MKKFLYIIFITLVFAGCSGKWKETAFLRFDFDIYGTEAVNYGFWFTGGEIKVSRLSFEGERLQARAVRFENDFEPSFLIDIPTGLTENTLVYDLPQGTYRNVDMELFLDSQIDSVPTIVLNGYFRDSMGTVRDVRFQVDGKIESKLITLYPGDRDDYSMVSGDQYSGRIRLNLSDWFSTIPRSFLESAEVDMVQGRETILISAERNVPIYSTILPKLGQFDEVQFE